MELGLADQFRMTKVTSNGRHYLDANDLHLTKSQVFDTINEYIETGSVEKARKVTNCAYSTAYEVIQKFLKNEQSSVIGRPPSFTLKKNPIIQKFVISSLDLQPCLLLREIAFFITSVFGVNISVPYLFLQLKELGYSRKKTNIKGKGRKSFLTQCMRMSWRIMHLQMTYDIRMFLFTDECTFSDSDYTRQYGRSRKGISIEEPMQDLDRDNINLLLLHGFSTVKHFVTLNSKSVTVTKESFYSFMEECMLTVQPGQVIILDNVKSHHNNQRLQDLATQYNITFLYLPPFSPDFNPIEFIFGWLKAKLKDTNFYFSNDISKLQKLEEAIDSLTPNLIQNFVYHCVKSWRTIPEGARYL